MKTGLLLFTIITFAAALIAMTVCVIMLREYKKEKAKWGYSTEQSSDPVHSNYRYIYPAHLKPALLHESEDDQYEDLLSGLTDYFDKEKIYLKNCVKITDVAGYLGTNKASLSKAINKVYGLNYSQMVNWFRVRYATTIFAEDPEMTMEDLCRRSGFQSMTTFTSAFSRYTGNTPAEWCKHYKKGKEVPPPVFVINKPSIKDVDKNSLG